MDQIWSGIVAQIAWGLVEGAIPTIAAAVIGWLVYWWQRLFKANFDAKARTTIQDALERGMRYAIQSMRDRQGVAVIQSQTGRQSLLTETASYVERFSGGTVKAKKLSHAELMELARAHLPLPPGVTLPSRSSIDAG
jgi:hypothetical protein